MAHSHGSRALVRAVQAFNVLVLAVLLIALAACSLGPTSGPLADGKAWAATCPKGQLAAYQGIDISGTFAEKSFGRTNEQVLRDVASRAAACDGHLRVVAFAGTSAQTFELFDGRLALPGATDNARWRRLPDVVEGVVTEVARRYEDAVASEPHSGSDIVGQLRLTREYADQIGANAYLSVIFTTDGMQSVAVRPTQVTTPEEARAFADELPVPTLGGELQVVGLGHRTDGQDVSSSTVELLKAFWNRICAQTGSKRCSAVTDYTSAVGSGS